MGKMKRAVARDEAMALSRVARLSRDGALQKAARMARWLPSWDICCGFNILTRPGEGLRAGCWPVVAANGNRYVRVILSSFSLQQVRPMTLVSGDRSLCGISNRLHVLKNQKRGKAPKSRTRRDENEQPYAQDVREDADPDES